MAEVVAWLGGWYNWPFLLPLCIGMLLVVAQVVLGKVGDAEVDVDADAEVDVDVDGSLGASLGWLGVGKVPLIVLLEVLLVSFGAVGLLINALAADFFFGAHAFPLALVAAVLLAPVITRSAAELLMRIVPANVSLSCPPEAFVGRVGISASRIAGGVGQVRVLGEGVRTDALLTARGEPKAEIDRGQEVLLTAYDPESRIYTVVPLDKEA